jgi:hypothetical protein
VVVGSGVVGAAVGVPLTAVTLVMTGEEEEEKNKVRKGSREATRAKNSRDPPPLVPVMVVPETDEVGTTVGTTVTVLTEVMKLVATTCDQVNHIRLE